MASFEGFMRRPQRYVHVKWAFVLWLGDTTGNCCEFCICGVVWTPTDLEQAARQAGSTNITSICLIFATVVCYKVMLLMGKDKFSRWSRSSNKRDYEQWYRWVGTPSCSSADLRRNSARIYCFHRSNSKANSKQGAEDKQRAFNWTILWRVWLKAVVTRQP
jgi:hypothetical protein